MDRKFQIGWFRVHKDSDFSDPFHHVHVKAGVYPIISMGYDLIHEEGLYMVKDSSVYILLTDGQQTLILTPKAHILAKSILSKKSDMELLSGYVACEHPEKPHRWYIAIENNEGIVESEVCMR